MPSFTVTCIDFSTEPDGPWGADWIGTSAYVVDGGALIAPGNYNGGGRLFWPTPSAAPGDSFIEIEVENFYVTQPGPGASGNSGCTMYMYTHGLGSSSAQMLGYYVESFQGNLVTGPFEPRDKFASIIPASESWQVQNTTGSDAVKVKFESIGETHNLYVDDVLRVTHTGPPAAGAGLSVGFEMIWGDSGAGDTSPRITSICIGLVDALVTAGAGWFLGLVVGAAPFVPPPPLCVRDWMGWTPPSVGAPDLHGDPAHNLAGDSDDGTGLVSQYERSTLAFFTGFDPGDAELCGGFLTIVDITGLQAVMSAAKDAADHAHAAGNNGIDEFVQVNMFLANNIAMHCECTVRWDRFVTGGPITYSTTAFCSLTFRTATGAMEHIVVNDSAIGSVVTIPDPGLTWVRASADNDYTWSHAGTDGGSLSGSSNYVEFYTDGASDDGVVFPLTIAQLFSTAGYFRGEWSVDEALGVLGHPGALAASSTEAAATAATFTDDFERAAAPDLGPSWVTPATMSANGYSDAPRPMQLVTSATPDNDGGTGAAMMYEDPLGYYNTSFARLAAPSPGHQLIEAVVEPWNDVEFKDNSYGDVYLYCQMTDTDDPCVWADFYSSPQDGFSTVYCDVYTGDWDWLGGDSIDVDDTVAVVVRLESDAGTNAVRAYVNGVQLFNGEAPGFVGDYVGIGVDMQAYGTPIEPGPEFVRTTWKGSVAGGTIGPFPGAVAGDYVHFLLYTTAYWSDGSPYPTMPGWTQTTWNPMPADPEYAQQAGTLFGGYRLWTQDDVDLASTYPISWPGGGGGVYFAYCMANSTQFFTGQISGSFAPAGAGANFLWGFVAAPNPSVVGTTGGGAVAIKWWGSSTGGIGTTGSGSVSIIDTLVSGNFHIWIGIEGSLAAPTIYTGGIEDKTIQSVGSAPVSLYNETRLWGGAPVTNHYVPNRRVMSVSVDSSPSAPPALAGVGWSVG